MKPAAVWTTWLELAEAADSGIRYPDAMHFLVAAPGVHGHLQPLLPFAIELKSRGHQVTLCGPAALDAVAAERGMPFVPVGPAEGLGFKVTEAKRAELDAMDEMQRTRQVAAYFEPYHLAVAPDIVRLAGEVRPHCIIRGASGLGAGLAGELTGIPVASINYLPPRPTGEAGKFRIEAINLLRQKVRLPAKPDPLDRDLILAVGVAGWYTPDELGSSAQPVQPSDPEPGAPPPQWLDAMGRERPLVYATLGTEFSTTAGAFEAMFAGLQTIDCDVVATVGPRGDPAKFPDLPDRIRIERYIPQAHVLTRCQAVVCHAGFGSLNGALARGLPVVTIPMGAAGNLANARRVERLGAGIAILPDARTGANIAGATRRILAEMTFAQQARTVASATAELPDVNDGADMLERHAANA